MSKYKAFADALLKAGARNSLKDRMAIQAAHDNVAFLVDGACCTPPAEKAASLAKAGARNARADLENILEIHDRLVKLGAECAKQADPLGN